MFSTKCLNKSVYPNVLPVIHHFTKLSVAQNGGGNGRVVPRQKIETLLMAINFPLEVTEVNFACF